MISPYWSSTNSDETISAEKLAELTKDRKGVTPGGSTSTIGSSRAVAGQSSHRRSVTECTSSGHPALMRVDAALNDPVSSGSGTMTQIVDNVVLGGAVDDDDDISRVWRQHGESILHHLLPPLPPMRRGGSGRYVS